MATTILTVDDDVHIQEILHLFLTDHGFNVHQAFNGEQCLSYLNKHKPELILLDISDAGHRWNNPLPPNQNALQSTNSISYRQY